MKGILIVYNKLYNFYNFVFKDIGMTQTFILVITAIVILYDIWAYFCLPEGNTVSEVMTGWSEKLPLVAFLWGALMMHWFGKRF